MPEQNVSSPDGKTFKALPKVPSTRFGSWDDEVVTHDAGTDSAWKVTGTIPITNPNDWQDITLTNLSDVANGVTCTLDAGPYIVPKSGSLDVNYSCTWSLKPSSCSGTNTATATWDKATYSTPNESASGSKAFTFTPTTIVDGSVTVVGDKTDPLNPKPATSRRCAMRWTTIPILQIYAVT